MQELKFKLEIFEGPLDLMLHLISKNKLNIFDIEITILLTQFLEYLTQMSEHNLDVTADFLEMAARLVYIKTISLLPRHEQAQELKKELEGILIEFALCKKIAGKLKEDYIGQAIYVREPMQLEIDKTYNRLHEAEEIWVAYMTASGRDKRNEPVNPIVFQPMVSDPYVTVFSKIVYVLRKLYKNGNAEIKGLYKNLKRSERVAVFLALLELAKSGRIFITDDNDYIEFRKSLHNENFEENEYVNE